MQIFLTNNSIIRPKISYQINLHFSSATYIFRHTYPYRIIDNIFMQFFLTIFSSRHTHFSTSIKCIQYSLLLIENYSQVIFDNLRQSSLRFDNIRIVYCIHGYISPQNVSSCQIMKLNVELCFPPIYSSNNYIPLIQKLKQKLFNKFMQNSTLLL